MSQKKCRIFLQLLFIPRKSVIAYSIRLVIYRYNDCQKLLLSTFAHSGNATAYF
jgi:hypothetical protein